MGEKTPQAFEGQKYSSINQRTLTAENPIRALRHPIYRWFWMGHFISLSGSWMQGVAQRWLIYELTASEALLGTVNAMNSLPALMLGLFSGSIADRFEKRRILLCSQISAASIAVILWLLTVNRWVQVWHIFILVLCLGLVRAFDVPARQAFWVELVGKEDLPSAITLHSAAVNLSRVLGPSIAGWLITLFGIANCFLLNAISFIPPILVLLKMPPTPVNITQAKSFWASVSSGLRSLRNDKFVIKLLLLVGTWSLFASQFDVLLPFLSVEVFDGNAKFYGFLTAGLGIGAVIGAVVSASLPLHRLSEQIVFFGTATAILGLFSLSLSPTRAIAILSIAVIGFGMATQNSTANTLIQSSVPDDLRGRAMGVHSLMFIGMMPIGSLFYGFVGHSVGVLWALRIGALCFFISSFLLLLPTILKKSA